MKKMTAIWLAILITSVIIIGLATNKNYFYLHLLLTGTRKYPTGEPINNMLIYKFDPQTVLTELDQGATNVFMPAPDENPIYNNVSPLEPNSSFPWNQEDSLKVAQALHRLVWKETLENWYLYSLGMTIPQCRDISRINSAGFQFYQRQEDWYYLVHEVDIDLEYGYVYVGDINGYYTGQWKDINLDNALVNTADQALLIAEQNGGREARLAVKGNQECYISINFPPIVYEHSTWKWEVAYRINNNEASVIYKITIDPFTGKREILPN